MGDLNDYRTPEEIAEDNREWLHIRSVLADAAEAGASLYAAMRLGEPQDVIELWTDRMWNGVRDSLDHEQLVTAVLELLSAAMWAKADRLTEHCDS